MQVFIRDMTVEDIPSITSIFNEAIRTTTAIFRRDPVTIEDRMQWFQRLVDLDRPRLVAVVKTKKDRLNAEQVVGYACADTFRPIPCYDRTVEMSMYIAKEYHRFGIGKRMANRLVEECRKRGYHVLVGAITAENEKSKQMAKVFGMSCVGTLHQVGNKFGRWLDVALYEKILDDESSEDVENTRGGDNANGMVKSKL